jgi:ribosomal protein S18 acetylase RimI-like enzyme
MFENRTLPAVPDRRPIALSGGEAPPDANAEAPGRITLDGISPADEDLLYRAFAATRAAEMALTGWHADQQETFLRMQYDMQRRAYRLQVPNAEYWVIRCDGTRAGRLILNRTSEDVHIVDIGLLPEFQGLGIGSALMAAILEEATQTARSVTLQVERFNPALQWYERLGFRAVGEGGPIYLDMIWKRESESASRLDQPAASESDSRVGAGTCLSN